MTATKRHPTESAERIFYGIALLSAATWHPQLWNFQCHTPLVNKFWGRTAKTEKRRLYMSTPRMHSQRNLHCWEDATWSGGCKFLRFWLTYEGKDSFPIPTGSPYIWSRAICFRHLSWCLNLVLNVDLYFNDPFCISWCVSNIVFIAVTKLVEWHICFSTEAYPDGITLQILIISIWGKNEEKSTALAIDNL